ncbi:MAG TPA: hypothetical protein VGQ33_03725 [Vicinamibacteria bacterium]|nr:hypothetical protein [Vicinamibacteria bacterium]
MRLNSAAAVCLAFTVFACSGKPAEGPGTAASPAAGKPITIGFSMDTLKEERWQRDRDLLVK